MEIKFLITNKLDLTYFPICRKVKDGTHKDKFIQICFTKFTDDAAAELIKSHCSKKSDGTIVFPKMIEVFDWFNKISNECFDILSEKMKIEYIDYDKNEVATYFMKNLFEIYGT